MKSRKFFYLDKIATILQESPTGNLKVEQIVKQLGITKKTLYNHFDSKFQLVESVIDFKLLQTVNAIRSEVGKGADPISSLLAIGNAIRSTYKEVSFIISQSGQTAKKDAFIGTYLKHLDNLLEITQLVFAKGERLYIFEQHLNNKLASQLFLSGLSMISREGCLLKPSLENKQAQSSVMYYLLKGYCTPSGLKMLRERIDIRVPSSNISYHHPALTL